VKRKFSNKRIFVDVLIVEDDVGGVSNLAQRIRGWGYSVENSDTCKDALGKVRKKQFDLVLLDIFLPDGKGHKLIPRLKELWPRIGIIAMTSYNSRKLEMEVREQGILYYMIKPFDTKYLKELLDHVSQKRAQQKH